MGQTINFTPGLPETLILGSPTALITNVINGFALGDQIEFSNGATITAAPSVKTGTTSIPYVNASGTTGTYQFSHLNYAPGTIPTFEYGTDFVTGDKDVALARLFTWNGATGASLGAAVNWIDNTDGRNLSGVVPGTLDFATFSGAGRTLTGAASALVEDFLGGGRWTLAANATLSASTSVQIGRHGTGTASLTVGTAAAITSRGWINVGVAAGNVDALNITGGVVQETGPGETFTHAMEIGYAGASGTLAAASGTVLVSGAGSLLDLGANGVLVAGDGGTGALNVALTGTVEAACADSSLSSAVSIANTAGYGSVLVSGAGSVLTANGYFLDGRGGTGSLIVQNSGWVVVNDSPLHGSGIGTLAPGAPPAQAVLPISAAAAPPRSPAAACSSSIPPSLASLSVATGSMGS